MESERFETIVIGGGQAGLTAGYYLTRHGRPFVILDADERVGDAWRRRWDSLRLFTPAKYSRLPGMSFPARAWAFPTKDEMADYIETYAARFELPVRTGIAVDGLSKANGRFIVCAGDARFEAENVIVATGAHRIPKVPEFARELDPRIVQLHSSEYRNPSQLQGGDVLVVGAGNSGAEIAFELSARRHIILSGPKKDEIPVRHGTFPARLGFRVFRFFGHHVVKLDNPIGKKVGPKLLLKGPPLIRTRSPELEEAGVERVSRVVGVSDGMPVLEDERVPDVANVIWCTGFRTEFGWIDLPVFGDDGQPLHWRGVVERQPGLYFLGLLFQYAFSSDVLPGVGRDAKYIAKHIASRQRSGAATWERALATA